jgi:DNA-binding IclR family transcriptional regulator
VVLEAAEHGLGIMEPSLLKSLRLLRETKALLTQKDLVERTKENEVYVKRALGKLVEKRIVAKNGEFYQMGVR